MSHNRSTALACNIATRGQTSYKKRTVAYSGGGRWCDYPPLWANCEFLYNFRTVFVSFVLRLNRKIRVQRLQVTVRVFCLLKTASKMHPNLSFWIQKIRGQPLPLHHTHSCRRQRRLAPSLALTEILNTPLEASHWRRCDITVTACTHLPKYV